MPNNWKTYKLSDIGEIIGGGTPSTSKQEYYNGDIPWITPRDLSNHSSMFISKGERSITQLGLKNSSAKLMPEGSVLLTSRAPIGYLAISKNQVCTNQGFKSIVVNQNLVNNKFIYYLLKSNIDLLLQNASGSTFQEISGSVVKNLEFDFPPLEEQKSIAAILSAIDDKIENNLTINKTLEEMAMALYKHWFVDFGPFQDGEFVDSEIFGINNFVSIPKNFKILNIKEEIIRLKPKNKYTQDNILKLGKIRVYDQSSARILGFHNNEPDFKADFENPLLIFGDHTCRMELICENFSVGPNLIPFKTNIKDYTYLVYLALKDKVKMNDYKRHWSELMLHQFVVPNEIHLLDDFNNLVKEFFNLINKNELENQTLTQLRDTLLPKLISGEVRLKEFVSSEK